MGGGTAVQYLIQENKELKEKIEQLTQNNIKIIRETVTFTVTQTGYAEHSYTRPSVDGTFICTIPVLAGYQGANQDVTWAYTGAQFWINSKTTGSVTFICYTFYK